MNLDVEQAGALVTPGLAAREIDGDSASRSTHTAHDARCANCQTPLAGSFCHGCGQRAHLHHSLLHLGEEVLHGILHLDAKAWRTLPMLVARPGQLTRRYVDGQRTRFVSPLALFLFMIFFMFFVVALVKHDSEENGPARASSAQAMTKVRSKLDKAFEKRLAKAEARLAAAKGGNEDPAEAQAELKEVHKGTHDARGPWSVYDGADGGMAAQRPQPKPAEGDSGDPNTRNSWPAIDAAIKHALVNPELTIYKLKDSASKFSFLLVPISLPFLWLMFFWRRGITMYDHAVFTLYSLSFMALLVAVLALFYMAGMKGAAWILLCFIPPIHMFMQVRGTYALGVFSSLWRTVALLFVASTVFVLYLGLILILSMR